MIPPTCHRVDHGYVTVTQEVCYSYIDLFRPRAIRQAQLQAAYSFTYHCPLAHHSVMNSPFQSFFLEDDQDYVITSQEVCYSYIDLFRPRAIRQAQLQAAYSFTCDCPRCSAGPGPGEQDEEALGGLACPGEGRKETTSADIRDYAHTAHRNHGR
jgi:hypothetical protein